RAAVVSVMSSPASPPSVYTLSLHDALPIFERAEVPGAGDATIRNLALVERAAPVAAAVVQREHPLLRPIEHDVGAAHVHSLGFTDRKSTRLNSSHEWISYAVFCLKKKTQDN